MVPGVGVLSDHDISSLDNIVHLLRGIEFSVAAQINWIRAFEAAPEFGDISLVEIRDHLVTLDASGVSDVG